jgi:anti-sigma factor (TIGR02949 family)
MNCREVIKIYQLYVDGEMEESHIDEFKKHINNCPDCQFRVQFEVQFKTTITRTVKSETQSAPDDLKEKILRSID